MKGELEEADFVHSIVEALEEILLMSTTTWKDDAKRMDPDSSYGCTERMKKNSEDWNFALNARRKKKSPWEFSDSRPGCPETILFLEDTKSSNGHDPQKPDLSEPALNMLLNKMIFIDLFQPKWFYGSQEITIELRKKIWWKNVPLKYPCSSYWDIKNMEERNVF